MNRKPLIAALALALVAPVAFAQSTGTDAAAQQSSTSATQSTQSTDATTATTGAATSTTDTGTQKKTWADVDTDKDGNLSQAEASSIPALSQVFAQADTNADGSLTADEYRTFTSAGAAATANDASSQTAEPAKDEMSKDSTEKTGDDK